MSKSKQQPAITGGPSPAIAESQWGDEQKALEHAGFQPNAGGSILEPGDLYGCTCGSGMTIPCADAAWRIPNL